MLHSEDAALAVVQEIANGLEPKVEIEGIKYRTDYQDYQFLTKDEAHFEVREKLIDLYIIEQDLDTKREIAFRINHAIPFEEWE